MLDLTPPPTLRDVAERAGVSVSTVNRVLADSPLAGAASREKVRTAIAELGYVAPEARPSNPTIADVAARADVSITTVSRVMSDTGQVQRATREKVLAAIAELDFVANGHARALNRGGQGQVAVLSSSMLGPAFVGIAQGIESVVSPLGHQFVVHTTGNDPADEVAHVASLREQRARAVVFIGGVTDDEAYRERMAAHARSLATVDCRLVLCGRPPVPGLGIPAVDYDNAGGVRSLTEDLLTQGHTRIAFIGGRQDQTTVQARLGGYREAMTAAGREPIWIGTTDWEAEDGADATRRLLDQHPDVTALVGVRDLVAVGALRELRRQGLSVPEDISVTGFDDLPLTGDLTPPLTTVRTPMRRLGEAVARYALAREITEGETTRLQVEIMRRGSTAQRRAPEER